MPSIPRQHHAKVRHGDAVAVDMVVVQLFFRAIYWGQMDDELVAEEVEIDPLCAAAPLGTAKHGAIKMAGFCQIGNRDGEVKWLQGLGVVLWFRL